MRDLQRSIGQSIVRMASFTGKELREVVRRPGVLASLILGPFVIMFIFGLGYSGYREPFATEIVVPADSSFPTDPEYYAQPFQSDVKLFRRDRENERQWDEQIYCVPSEEQRFNRLIRDGGVGR